MLTEEQLVDFIMRLNDADYNSGKTLKAFLKFMVLLPAVEK
jgi:hypothetical protein